ncbi:MAG: hypothetical protein WBB45_18280 [Cyclobacteriaceae bacterium]
MKHLKVLICLLPMFVLACREEKSADAPAPQPKPDISLEPSELVLFDKIQRMEEAVSQLWPSFDMTEFPAYIITESPEAKGYFVNSPVHRQSLYKIEDAPGRMTFYRNDDYIQEVEEYFGAYRFYALYYKIEGVEHMIMRPYRTPTTYTEYKNKDSNFFPLVYTHELFHVYQAETWNLPDGSDETFTASEEFLLLNLLLHDLMAEAYSLNSEADMRRYLRYYAGLRYEMMQLDDTTTAYVEEMLLNGELLEGTARYIEVFSARQTIYPDVNSDPTHTFGNLLRAASNPDAIEHSLLIRPRYHIGAIVTYMLMELGVDVEQRYTAGNTPYEVTVDFLQLNTEHLSEAAMQSRAEVNYPDYQVWAAELMAHFE